MLHGNVSRRKVLGLMGLGAAGSLLAACQPEVVEKLVTKEVEKVVTTEVEKVVKETVVVQEEVTRVVEKEVKVASDRVTVEWWWQWGGMTGLQAMTGVVNAFNESRQDIFVHGLQISEDTNTKLMTAIAGGTPPDITAGNLAVAEFGARGALTPLNDYFEASDVVTFRDPDIVSTLWDDGTWEGKLYSLGICECGPADGMGYNVRLVEEAGLDADNPPQTWDELYDWHEKMTTFDDAGNVEILGFDPLDAMGGRHPSNDIAFLWGCSFGFEWWDQETMSFHFSEGFDEALATVKKFYDFVGVEKVEGFRSSYGTWTQSPTASFPAGVQGAILNGYWTPGELFGSSPDERFRFTWVPMPKDRKGITFQNMRGEPTTIPKGAKRPEEAFQFLEFLTTPPSMDVIFNLTGWMGPRLSWLRQANVGQYEGLDWFMSSITEADELHPCPLCPISSFVAESLIDTWDEVNYGDKTPAEAAQDLDESLTRELAEQFPDLVG